MNDMAPLGPSLYSTVSKNIRLLTGRFYSVLSKEDIEDLVHDTYLRVMDYRDKVDPTKNVNGWIYRICKNCVNSYTADIKKRNGMMDGIDDDYDEDNSSYRSVHPALIADNSYMADTPMYQKEFDRRFWNSVNNLTPEHKDVAMMLIDETPYNKMAERLGCSEDTLRVKVHRTRRALLKLGIAA